MTRLAQLFRMIRDSYVAPHARIAAALVLVSGLALALLVARSFAPDGAETAVAATDEPSPEMPPAEPAPPKQEIEPVARPDVVKGIYLNAWAAGSPRKRAKLIDLAKRTEINAFVIDVKEGGFISYQSEIPLANELGLDSMYIRNIRDVLQQVKDAGIYPIARIVIGRDPILAERKPEFAIRKADGSLWADRGGYRWVDMYNKGVWDYNIAIAREAVKLGFAEVQWDYVRFPDVPRALMNQAVFTAQNGRTKQDAVREFLLYSREQLADLKVPVTADVFGLTVTFKDDMGIGQQWEKMVDATDVLLPMVYPSHYQAGNYGLRSPNAAPYETILAAMKDAVRRSAPFENRATIRPWLQDFTLGPPRYGAKEVRAQIQAVYDAGLEEWILWNPGSNYTEAALRREGEAEPARNAAPASAGSADKPAVKPATQPPKVDASGLLGKPVPLPADTAA